MKEEEGLRGKRVPASTGFVCVTGTGRLAYGIIVGMVKGTCGWCRAGNGRAEGEGGQGGQSTILRFILDVRYGHGISIA